MADVTGGVAALLVVPASLVLAVPLVVAVSFAPFMLVALVVLFSIDCPD
jgi:hypothetical protein